jgi:hypothetical protein
MTRRLLACALAFGVGVAICGLAACDSNKTATPTKDQQRPPKSEPRAAPGGAGLTPDNTGGGSGGGGGN